MTKKLPQQALDVIERYKNLNLGGKKVVCPYFINTAGVRAGLKVMLGKGSPSEIEEEAILIAKHDNVALEDLEPAHIREFLKKSGLGIDCSGFITNILLVMLGEKKVKNLAVTAYTSIIRRFLAKFRPVENLSVQALTNSKNSSKIDRWQDSMPGDMIKTRSGKHVLLIEETERNSSGELLAITYIHSTNAYGNESGVRNGKVIVVRPAGTLEEQNWQESDEASRRNITYEGLLDGETNGIYRLL